MSILTASNLGQSFGAFDLFSGISVTVANDGKIGLVGPNGIGKTTLLLFLAGLSQPSAGMVAWARGSRLGYLPQEAAQAFAGHDSTVYDEMLTVFADLRAAEARLRDMENQMAAGDDSVELFERYSEAQAQFEFNGGYEYEVRIHQVLQGLGFGAADWTLPVGHLSGGQKTRALLARLLLEKPDLLILDEPTNHLDVEAVEWLENTLNAWDGAILLVSHDRYFLDKVVNTIWEMSRRGIEVFHGNYTAYSQQREERWLLAHQEYSAQKERLEKELDFIRRNIAGQRVQMAKGKLSRLSRELDAMQRVGRQAMQGKSWSQLTEEMGKKSAHVMNVAEVAERIKELERPPGAARGPHLNLRAEMRSGELVLRTTNLSVGYPGKVLFTADDLELRRQECAALIGPNGSGKTTFLRTLRGKIEPLAGQVKLGASLRVGYFAQSHDFLQPDNSVLDELLRHKQMLNGEARDYLARYLFRGEDVFKQVAALSGGERGRLALAILALEEANFLLLDEPTNHLDIPSQEGLQEALEQFAGTILLVSHDRYLVDRLATQIWNLEDGRLQVFKGPYQEYLVARETEMAGGKWQVASGKSQVASRASRRLALPSANGRRPSTLKENKAVRQRAEELARLEDEISQVEVTLERLAQELQVATQASSFERVQQLGRDYTAGQSHLEELLARWETMAHE